MLDLIYRFVPNNRDETTSPLTPETARKELEDGNRQFAIDLDPTNANQSRSRIIHIGADRLGLPLPDGSPPTQRPFAAVLGCSDARVPIEMIFGQACNALFVVRVAGNVLGAECLGSLDYALANLGDDLKLIVVLGHRGCGAVTAAVDAFIDPARYLRTASTHPLRAVVDRIFVAARAGHKALEDVYSQRVEERPGYRAALIETTVALNAAITAATVRQEFRDVLAARCDVVYGVYDLTTRRVKLPLDDDGQSVKLSSPPATADAFDLLGVRVARGPIVRDLLEGDAPPPPTSSVGPIPAPAN